MSAPTLEQVDNQIKALREETNDAIRKALEGVPDTVRTAIERQQAKAAMPGRLPTAGAGAPPDVYGEWTTEPAGIKLRSGSSVADDYFDVVTGRAAGFSARKSRNLALLRAIGRHSPAAVAYSDSDYLQQYDGRLPFSGFGDYLRAVGASKPGPNYKGPDRRLKTAFAEGSGDTGGFLVPEQFRAELMALEIEGAQFEPLATTLPMSAMHLSIPTIRDTTHVGSVFGGVTGFWEPEAGTLSESEPTFGQTKLEAHKLTLYTVASNEVLNDSAIGLEALIRQRFPEAETWYKETGYWNGDGGGMPEGVLNCGAVYSVAKETGQAASTILTENIVNMYSHMLPTSHKRAVWFCHPNVLPQLFTMSLSVGTGGGPIFVQFGGMQNEFPGAIFGRPLYVSEHLQSLGTAGDIAYVDLSYYLIGTRQDLSFEASPHVKFINDQTVWRLISRLDGRPWIDSTLTLEHGSFQVSPFVTLATRS